MRHGVHAHRAVVGLAEGFRLLAQLVIGGWHEMVPGEEGQLPLLGEGGGLAEGEPRGDTGGGAGSGAEELTSGRDRSIGRRHAGLPANRWEIGRHARTRPVGSHLLVSEWMVATLYRSPRALSRGAQSGNSRRTEPMHEAPHSSLDLSRDITGTGRQCVAFPSGAKTSRMGNLAEKDYWVFQWDGSTLRDTG